MVDPAGDEACAETVIDVDYTDAAGAAIEHTEQGGEAAEAGAVADTGGHGNDGSFDQSADHTWEGTFHPGNHDHDAATVDQIETR